MLSISNKGKNATQKKYITSGFVHGAGNAFHQYVIKKQARYKSKI